MEGRKYFFLPVNTGYVDGESPDDRCVEFYARRSGNGLYCAIVGNVVIPNGHASNSVCARISSDSRWRRLADAIRAGGARPGIQFSSAWPDFHGIKKFLARDADVAIEEYRSAAKGISVSQVQLMLADLEVAAELALGAGFDHIQVHAAHGYLYSLLIDETFWPHSDVVHASLGSLARKLGKAGVESSLRFSVTTGHKKTDESAREVQIARLFELPFSFFDVADGFYNVNKQLIYPSTEPLLTRRRETTFHLARRFSDTQIIYSGKASAASPSSLPENVHVGLCRDLIANPNFLKEQSNGCTNCMKCHYFSRGARDLTCGQWDS